MYQLHSSIIIINNYIYSNGSSRTGAMAHGPNKQNCFYCNYFKLDIMLTLPLNLVYNYSKENNYIIIIIIIIIVTVIQCQ